MLQFGIKQSRYAKQKHLKKKSEIKIKRTNKAKFVNNNLFVCYYGALKYFSGVIEVKKKKKNPNWKVKTFSSCLKRHGTLIVSCFGVYR